MSTIDHSKIDDLMQACMAAMHTLDAALVQRDHAIAEDSFSSIVACRDQLEQFAAAERSDIRDHCLTAKSVLDDWIVTDGFRYQQQYDRAVYGDY